VMCNVSRTIMWVDAQQDGRPGGALCESSVIPLLVPRCKKFGLHRRLECHAVMLPV